MQIKDVTDWQALKHVPYYGVGSIISGLQDEGVAYGVALQKTEELAGRYIDWGTSINFVWVTEQGREYRAQLELASTPGLTEHALRQRMERERAEWEARPLLWRPPASSGIATTLAPAPISMVIHEPIRDRRTTPGGESFGPAPGWHDCDDD